LTHTNHRRGVKESLQSDYVVLAMLDPSVEAQYKYGGSQEERTKELLFILAKHNPVALMALSPERRLRYMDGWKFKEDRGIHRAATIEEILKYGGLGGEGLVHAVYSDQKFVENTLKELKEADLGFSIVISGVFNTVFDVCKDVGIRPHTVNISLGTWGRKELLPKDPVLELCTMCGHAMISTKLAETMIKRINKGAITPDEAAVELGKQCTCNIFNTKRAVEIIRNASHTH